MAKMPTGCRLKLATWYDSNYISKDLIMWHTNCGGRTLEGAEARPDEDCEDEQEWLIEIEELSYLILWDTDYEDEDLYIDKPPEEAQRLKDFMRMRDDYFLEIPEDLKPEEVETRLTDLKNLCRSICKKSEVKKD